MLSKWQPILLAAFMISGGLLYERVNEKAEAFRQLSKENNINPEVIRYYEGMATAYQDIARMILQMEAK